MIKILIINGPNLNLTGQREKEVYGEKSFGSYLSELKNSFPRAKIEYFQSNVEGELINCLHENDAKVDGIIINAGGYTHTSVAIGDAVKAIKTPVIEVHMSNIFAREPFRHQSHLAPSCIGTITGFGLDSYRLALLHLLR